MNRTACDRMDTQSLNTNLPGKETPGQTLCFVGQDPGQKCGWSGLLPFSTFQCPCQQEIIPDHRELPDEHDLTWTSSQGFSAVVTSM
jgi:hypothetical protein